MFNNLLATASLFRKSWNRNGGHLTAGELSYIRIPKSASTSIGKEMLLKKYPQLATRKITEKQINFLVDVNLQNENPSDVIFTIVRNPFSRLVSVYRDFFEGSNYIYHDYLFGMLTKSLSFPEFVNRISCIPDRLLDQHLCTQSSFLQYYESRKLNVKVLKLEEPEEIIQFLANHSMQLSQLNQSQKTVDYRSYYDRPTVEKVRQLYERDIVKFGYEPALKDLQNRLKTVH